VNVVCPCVPEARLPDANRREAGEGQDQRGGAAVEIEHRRVAVLEDFQRCTGLRPAGRTFPGAKDQRLVNRGMFLEYGGERCFHQDMQLQVAAPVMKCLDERQSED